VPLLLALTWGGSDYPWASAQIIALFAMFVVFTGLFIWAETRHKDPIIHLELFGNKVFTWANIAAFFSSMAFLSSVAFLPFFMQVGQGIGATASGLAIMPLMLGLILASIVSGQVVSKTGRYKPSLLVGAVVVLVGIFLLSRMTYQTSQLDLSWRMVVLGIGLGPLQATFNIAIQNAIPPSQIGVVTGANQFFRQIGSTIGVALFGTLFFQKLRSQGLDVSQVNEMRAPGAGGIQLPEPVKEIIANSITSTFSFALIVIVISILAILMIPELPMQSMADIRKAREADGDPPPEAHV
jgi:fucose permease